MKKYFLDKAYEDFTTRVFLVISIIISTITAVVTLLITEKNSVDSTVIVLNTISGFAIAFITVWVSYFTIKWILKSLPN